MDHLGYIKATPMTLNVPSPPRFSPDRPLPPYAYLPGHHPHPTRDPDGHSFGNESYFLEAPDPTRWRDCDDYLYGIDLFNYGFYWEAHEAWEGLWHAFDRRSGTANYLQGLINFAAAGLKVRWGNIRGVRGNAHTAARLFATAARLLGPDCERYMGLEVQVLLRWTTELAERPAVVQDENTETGDVPFEFMLLPE